MSDQASRIGQEQSNTKSDPTALTTDALQREIAQLTHLFDTKLEKVNQSIADQRELRVAQIANLQEQINHSEKLRLELKADNEKNIDRALLGVEKANEKLEISLTRTLAQMAETSRADVSGLRRDIDGVKDRVVDNKERVVAVEGQKTGATDYRAALLSLAAVALAAIGLAVALLR